MPSIAPSFTYAKSALPALTSSEMSRDDRSATCFSTARDPNLVRRRDHDDLVEPLVPPVSYRSGISVTASGVVAVPPLE